MATAPTIRLRFRPFAGQRVVEFSQTQKQNCRTFQGLSIGVYLVEIRWKTNELSALFDGALSWIRVEFNFNNSPLFTFNQMRLTNNFNIHRAKLWWIVNRSTSRSPTSFAFVTSMAITPVDSINFIFFFVPDENSAIFFFQWNQQQDKTFGRPQMSQWRARALKRNQTCKQRGGQNRIVSFKEVFPSYKIIIKWKEKGQPSSVEIGLHYSRSAW